MYPIPPLSDEPANPNIAGGLGADNQVVHQEQQGRLKDSGLGSIIDRRLLSGHIVPYCSPT